MSRIVVDPPALRAVAAGIHDDCWQLARAIADALATIEALGDASRGAAATTTVRALEVEVARLQRAAAVAAWVADAAEALDRQGMLLGDVVVAQVLRSRLDRMLAARPVDHVDAVTALQLLRAVDTPRAVAALWGTLDADVRGTIEETAPQVVAWADGIPPGIRDRCNRRLLAAYLSQLEAEARDLALHAGSVAGVVPALRRGQAQALRRRAQLLRANVAGADQVLVFDPSGDGCAVLVHGDLLAADVVAVLVPGMTSSLDRLGMVTGFGRQLAAALDEVTDTQGPGPTTATISWLGYDAPSGLDAVVEAAGPGAAADGATALLALADGIRVTRPRARIVAVGHSYGGILSLDAGLGRGGAPAAAQAGPLDGVVLLGAPGIGRAPASSLSNLPGQMEVHAAEVTWDGVPNLPVHGPNPVDVAGVETIPMGPGNRGHSGYLTPGTQGASNVARVVLGLPVQPVQPRPAPRAAPTPPPRATDPETVDAEAD